MVGADQLDEVLPGAAGVILALPVLPDTTGVIGAAQLALMDSDAWLVNVARGAHVDTDAFVDALHAGSIGGAALDVTDPEPLPAGHPLWSAPNCVITPHVGNTAEMAFPLLSARITENVRRYGAGEPLGPVDVDLGTDLVPQTPGVGTLLRRVHRGRPLVLDAIAAPVGTLLRRVRGGSRGHWSIRTPGFMTPAGSSWP